MFNYLIPSYSHTSVNFKCKPSVKADGLLQVKGRHILYTDFRTSGYVSEIVQDIEVFTLFVTANKKWYMPYRIAPFPAILIFRHLHCYLSLSQLLKLDFKLLDTVCIVFVLLGFIAKIWLHVHVSCYRVKSINGRSTDQLAVVSNWIFTRHRSRYYYFSHCPYYLLLLPLLQERWVLLSTQRIRGFAIMCYIKLLLTLTLTFLHNSFRI